MKRFVIALGILFVLTAACGGGDGPAQGEQGSDPTDAAVSGDGGSSVVSDDGLVELTIPAGSVPEGTDVSVTAAAMPEELVVEGADVFVYDLEPSGLEFDNPATLALTLPRQAEGIVLGVVAVGDTPADLEHVPASFTVDDGTVTVTTEITHFSTFVAWIGGEQLTVIDECPQEMIVGGPLCDIRVEDFDQHPGLRLFAQVPPSGEQFFTESQERPDGSVFSCQNPTDRLRPLANLSVGVFDWTLEELFRLVGAKIEYKGGDDYDEFEYVAYADCIVEDSFFEDDPASQIPGGIAVTVTDPTGDFLAEEDLMSRGFGIIEQDPPPGLDIVDVAVAYAPDGDVTEVTVCFAGEARGLAGDGRSLSIRPVFLRGGEYFFEASYMDGSSHVSGGPDGVTVTHVWTAADKIRFTIEGFAPTAGDQLRLDVFSRLSTDGGEAVQGDTATVDID